MYGEATVEVGLGFVRADGLKGSAPAIRRVPYQGRNRIATISTLRVDPNIDPELRVEATRAMHRLNLKKVEPVLRVEVIIVRGDDHLYMEASSSSPDPNMSGDEVLWSLEVPDWCPVSRLRRIGWDDATTKEYFDRMRVWVEKFDDDEAGKVFPNRGAQEQMVLEIIDRLVALLRAANA